MNIVSIQLESGLKKTFQAQKDFLTVPFLRKQLLQILKALKLKKKEIHILLCRDPQMQQFNLQYRNQDKATDILSFPWNSQRKTHIRKDTDHKGNQNFEPYSEQSRFKDADREEILGDIAISLDQVLQWTKEENASFLEILQKLLIHGVLHLLGYDHKRSPEEDQWMRKLEEQTLWKIKNMPIF